MGFDGVLNWTKVLCTEQRCRDAHESFQFVHTHFYRLEFDLWFCTIFTPQVKNSIHTYIMCQINSICKWIYFILFVRAWIITNHLFHNHVRLGWTTTVAAAMVLKLFQFVCSMIVAGWILTGSDGNRTEKKSNQLILDTQPKGIFGNMPCY